MLLLVAALDNEINHTSDQICSDKNPANWGNSQEITNHAMPPAKQPEITRQNKRYHRNTEDDKPRILVFSEFYLHAFTTSFKRLHHGQYFTQLS